MSQSAVVVIIYGIFCIVGGVIGFKKVKSGASLAAGLLSGVLLLVCGQLLLNANKAGAVGSAVVAFLLGGRFLMTWSRTRRFMPDLAMILLSVLTLVSVAPYLR